MGYVFDEVEVESRQGTQIALISSPDKRMRTTIDSIQRAATRGVADDDTKLLARVARMPRCDLLIFRGEANEGSNSWRMSTHAEDDLPMLAAKVLEAQLKTYRALLELGVAAIIHTEFGEQAVVFRHAARNLRHRVAARRGKSSELDQWILGHFVYFHGAKLERAMSSLIPVTLDVMHNLRPRVAGLLARANESYHHGVRPPVASFPTFDTRPGAE